MANLVPEKRISDFEQMGFGMFVHFGIYSNKNMGEWVYNIHNLERDEYDALVPMFKVPTMKEIVKVAKSAGCKYITLTTRHHDGFSLYDTKGLSDYDAVHSPVGRDLVAEFVDECRKEDIVPFFYHTTIDWYNTDYVNNFDQYLDYLYKSVEILCTSYGEIGGLWFDGNWDRPDADWKEERLYKMIHRHQPNAMIINNTGLFRLGELGNEEIDAVTYERGLPRPLDRTNHTKYITGEMCQTLCDHWGKADDFNFKSVKSLIKDICNCRKVGANMLLNIGPNGDGTVEKMQEATMECIGRWMKLFGKAIYNGRPFIAYDDKEDFFLIDNFDEKTAYYFRMEPGRRIGNVNVTVRTTQDPHVSLDKIPHEIESITWMDDGEVVPFTQNGDKLEAEMQGYFSGFSHCTRVAEVKFK